jgi:hypothetical protein
MKHVDKMFDWLSLVMLLAACISAVVKLINVLSGRYSMLFALVPVTDEFIEEVLTVLKYSIPPIIMAWAGRLYLFILERLHEKHEKERV